MQDNYMDEGSVKVGSYTIKNATKVCEGTHNFLHALVYSCNIGMVRIVQKIQKYAFYNYLVKLGFGALTEIELAGEKEGFIDDMNIVSVARFLNNSFGQGLTTTQIQLAAAYAALVNGGKYIKPTVISQIIDHSNTEQQEIPFSTAEQDQKQIFKNQTSSLLKE